jgi:hypothetical protein
MLDLPFHHESSWARESSEMSGQKHASAALLLGKEPSVSIYKKLDGLQGISGRRRVRNVPVPALNQTPRTQQ